MTKHYRQANAIVARQIGDEMALVPVRQNVGDLENLYTLNATGAALWRQLSEPRTQEELTLFLVTEFEVMPNQAGADVQAFLTELAQLNLTEESPWQTPTTAS